MKKQILFFIVFSLSVFQVALAQEDQFNSKPMKEKPSTKKYYLGVATGLDNFTGLLGPSFEANIVDNLTLFAGAGVGGWGYKISGGAKYYINYPYKISFNLGFSHATGGKNVPVPLETTASGKGATSQVIVDLNPANTVNLSASYNFKMGKKNRFSLELGYAVPISSDYYEIKNNFTLTETGEEVLRIMQPGGLILGVGFSFGL